MQKTEHFGCPWRKDNAPLVLSLVAVIIVSASLSARAQDTGTQLAMNRPNFSTVNVSTTTPARTEPVRSALTLKSANVTSQAGQTKVSTNPAPVVTVSLAADQSGNSEQNSPLVLAHEKLSDHRSVIVAAGYGRLWDGQCAFKYIAPARQEPSCAYLKASINF